MLHARQQLYKSRHTLSLTKKQDSKINLGCPTAIEKRIDLHVLLPANTAADNLQTGHAWHKAGTLHLHVQMTTE